MNIPDPNFISKKKVFALMVGLTILIVIGGVIYYNIQSDNIRKQKYDELRAIADLKVVQIENWFRERSSEVNLVARSPGLEESVKKCIRDTHNLVLKNEMLKKLSFYQNELDYDNIFLVSTNKKIILSVKPVKESFNPLTLEKLDEAYKKGKLVFTDLYISEKDSQIHYDIIAPVKKKNNEFQALLVFRRNPQKYLFPMINRWPTPSLTAETLIIRPEKDSVLFLSNLRFKKDTALKFKIAKSNTRIPSVQAALGNIGIFEGIDYRGKEVISESHRISSTNWVLITKIDKSEIFSDLNVRAIMISGFSLLLIIIAGVSIAYFYSSSQRKMYHQMYKKENELQRKIQESESRLRSTFDSMLEGCQVIGHDYRYLYLNDEVVRQSHLTKEELLNKTMMECYPGIENTNLFKVISRCMQQRIPAYIDNVFTFSDGTQGFFKLDIEPVPEGVLILSENITENKIAEEKLRESNKRFNRLVSELKDIVWTVSIDRTTLYDVNDTVEEIYGVPKSVVKTNLNYWKEVVHPDDLKIVEESEKELWENGKSSAEYRIRRPDGKIVWLLDRKTLIYNDEGKPIQIGGISSDVTERKNIELELRAAKEKAEEMNRLKSSFFANMSHELRTPLTGINGLADYLRHELKDPEFKEVVESIYFSGKRLAETINSILDFSKIDAEKTKLIFEFADLVKETGEIISLFIKTAEGKGLALKFYYNTPIIVTRIDPVAYRSIMNNLISNALKFTEKGEVKVELIKDENKLEIKVKDSGIGISRDNHRIIFEEFRQVSEGMGRSFEGTGLGLSITKTLVEKMGGTISLDSEIGKGSTFTIIFPV